MGKTNGEVKTVAERARRRRRIGYAGMLLGVMVAIGGDIASEKLQDETTIADLREQRDAVVHELNAEEQAVLEAADERQKGQDPVPVLEAVRTLPDGAEVDIREVADAQTRVETINEDLAEEIDPFGIRDKSGVAGLVIFAAGMMLASTGLVAATQKV